jgi:hypothetical protein
MNVYVRDLAERVVVTFAQGFLGSLVVTEMTDKSVWLAAVGGGVAAVTALLKGLVAKRVGNNESASLTGGV